MQLPGHCSVLWTQRHSNIFPGAGPVSQFSKNTLNTSVTEERHSSEAHNIILDKSGEESPTNSKQNYEVGKSDLDELRPGENCPVTFHIQLSRN